MAEQLDWRIHCAKRSVCDAHCGRCDRATPAQPRSSPMTSKKPNEVVEGPTPDELRDWAKHVRYGITNPNAPILKLAEFLDTLATQAGAITCANCKGGVVTQELPDSALDVHGLCGYCRRVGIRAEHLAGVSKMMPLARYPYEVGIGSIIRNATDPHPDLPVGSMFTLKCSVGELAQRIARALAEQPDE